MTKSLILPSVLFGLVLFSTPQQAQAHCQVPCGIFADQVEFEKLVEAHTTIAKANAEIAKLLADDSPRAFNQATRWVVTKEDHCKKIMESVGQYFMAQRIKPDALNYQKVLVAAHNVMRAAMKAKQDPSSEVAASLKKTIFDLYRAYEGKDPNFRVH